MAVARDEDLDYLKAIRLLAWNAVEKRPSDYLMRHIYRWYSKTFHVPLPQVDDLPIEDVLQAFFEERYENLPDEERDDEEERLRETRAERLAREAREREEQESDDAFFREAQAEAARQRQAAPVLDKKLPSSERPFLVAAPTMGEALPTHFAEVAQSKEAEKLREIPPEINMQFVGEDELGDLDDWDVCGPPRPKK